MTTRNQEARWIGYKECNRIQQDVIERYLSAGRIGDWDGAWGGTFPDCTHEIECFSSFFRELIFTMSLVPNNPQILGQCVKNKILPKNASIFLEITFAAHEFIFGYSFGFVNIEIN